MNLLEDKWLPIRRTNGSLDWIAPHQITEPDIVSLAANRPDFNGALIQFLIGLLQTTTIIDDEIDWADSFDEPPSAAILQAWFAPVTNAFVLDGEGARFMQDFSLEVPKKDLSSIDSLLIDAAGESTKLKNTDHFVKRNTVNALCPCCVATALFTLHLNAPAGGAGNRTGLRGGGPLTTLVIATPSRGLWHDVWLNVVPKSAFFRLQKQGDIQKIAPYFTFPWLADIGCIQTLGGETQPSQVHPHHVFWAMPRRIRLDFSEVKTGQCDICKRPSNQLVSHYITKPQGLNYNGWCHPLSPYYKNKEDKLPVHPQPSGFSYKNWLAWVLGSINAQKQVYPANIIHYALAEKDRQKDQQSTQLRMWVFGYDMDKMKPRCWYETTFPLYELGTIDKRTQKDIAEIVLQRIEAAEQTTFYIRQAIKYAWFGDGDMRGDLSFADKAFWDSTEAEFYGQLRDLLAHAQSTAIDMGDEAFIIGIGTKWHNALVKQALDMFDKDIVGAGAIDQQNPQRIAKAYNGLRMNLYGKALKSILRLPVADKKDKPEKSNKVTKAKTPQPKQPPQPNGQLSLI